MRLLYCSPARHGAYWRRNRALPGERESRESFTQDSRSPRRARRHCGTSRSVTRIIRRRALHSSRQKTWRPRQRPSRDFGARITRSGGLESRADRGMRSCVTGGARELARASNDARSVRAPRCVSAAAERHIAVGELVGSPHASGVTPRASHTARSAPSWGSG